MNDATGTRTTRPGGGDGRAKRRVAGRAAPGALVPPAEPRVSAAFGPVDSAAWREFVGRWLEAQGCHVGEAARGDWEVALSPELQRRWRRQRVRLVFDPLRPTLPRGAWFTAPGSAAGRKILDAARDEPALACRTALPRVPGAPAEGLAAVCRVRGLTWGTPRLGPVRYERRMAFHAVVTLWGGLPVQESWVLLLDRDRSLVEWQRGRELPNVRSRDGLGPGQEPLQGDECARWAEAARGHLDALLTGRELSRLSAFFAARVEEEEERSRRRGGNGDAPELEGGDATSLKVEWERRAAEVSQRWALRTDVRLWGLEEWSWPVAELEQGLKVGAVRVKLVSRVDVARGQPELPACPSCGSAAEMLVRVRGAVACEHCAP